MWGTIGYGRGRLHLDENEDDNDIDTHITLSTGAVGGRMNLLSREWFDLALKGDVLGVHVHADGTGDLARIDGNVFRMRGLLEGVYEHVFSDGSVLRPSLEAGLRFDAGDAEGGTGVEVGARVRYDTSASDFSLEAGGRFLATHSDRSLRNWGVYGLLRFCSG